MKARVVRSATLIGYLNAAQEVGVDGEALIAAVGLTTGYTADPDRLIPVDSFIRLLDLSVAASGRSDFGARAAIARGVPDFGAVSLLLREEETLGDALRTISARLHLHCNGIYLELDARFGKPFLSYQIVSDTPSIQASEFCACGLVQSIRWLVGTEWRPDAVCYEHARPLHTSVQGSFMRSELRYNQVMGGILLSKDALDLRVITSAAVLRRHARNLIEHTLPDSLEHFEIQVTRVMVRQLRDSTCNADTLASSLGMNRRTLHRRLANKGLSYSSLLQQVRSDTAKQLVEAGTIPLSDVAETVGFNSLSSFSRWFQATFGCTASAWKRNRNASH